MQNPQLPGESRVGIHKRFGARKKTGSELIFLQIDFKISFFSVSTNAIHRESQCFTGFLKKDRSF
jgi:hypothetical protein